jgi:hypothetical protein
MMLLLLRRLTFLAGVRRLLFRCPGEVSGKYTNHFSHKPDASAAVRQLIAAALPAISSYNVHTPLSSRRSSSSSMACSESSSSADEAEERAPAGAEVVVTAGVDGGKGLAAAQLKVQLSVEAGSGVVVAAH